MKPLVFLSLVVALSLPWWILSRDVGGYGYITALMWSPAVAGALTLKLTGGSLSDLGWRGVSLGWIFAAWGFTLITTLLTYSVVFGAGLIQLADLTTLKAATKVTGLPNPASWTTLLVLLVIAATAGAIRLAAPALGEELGWRGFLSPLLCNRFGFVLGAFGTGLIWSAWHYPLMIGKIPAWQVANFTVTITGLSFAYTWFRARSGSVWPTTLMHGLHNALGEIFFLKVLAAGPAADRWLDETGFAMPLLGVLVAVSVIIFGLPNQPTTSPSP